MSLKAPFPWFGGKSRAADLIWRRLGNPRHFIEPFAGSLAVLLSRPHEPKIETVNDADAYLANFWRALRLDPDGVAEHADWPVNEADLHARHRWLVGQAEFRERMMADPEFYDVRIAGWWVWGLSCWIGNGWCSAPRPATQAPVLANGGSGTRGSTTSPGRGIHGKRPLIHPDREGHGVHGKRPILTGNGESMAGVQSRPDRRRPGPQNTGAFGTLGAPGDNDLADWFGALQDRLRRVRVCCGDWSRVVTPAVLGAGGGTTAVLLDPPYDTGRRSKDLYSVDVAGLAETVREWALSNGDNPRLRIALCGLEEEHPMPESWEAVAWTTRGGYGVQDGGDHANRREVTWFSPHCLRQPTLFDDQPDDRGINHLAPEAARRRKKTP